MGNVVAASALNNGMLVNRYSLCNAAMAAMAYDASPTLKNDLDGNPLSLIFLPHEARATPDTHANADVRRFGLSKKVSYTGLPRMVNFGLPMDHALGVWSVNNMAFKADTDHGYSYEEQRAYPHTLNCSANGNAIRAVSSLSEAMGYVTKFLTRTVGADLRTKDAIKDFKDMSHWGDAANHAGFGDEHSAQWKWNYYSTHHFWEELARELEIGGAQ